MNKTTYYLLLILFVLIGVSGFSKPMPINGYPQTISDFNNPFSNYISLRPGFNETRAPQVNCINYTLYLDSSGNATLMPSQVEDGTYSGNALYDLSLSQTVFDCYDLGPNTVTLTLTEISDGTTSTCNATVTVEGNIAANITPLPDIHNECIVTSLTTPSATDNCGSIVGVTNDASLPITTQGTTIVTWTFSDSFGNVSTQTQNVIIDDTTPPDTPTLDDVTGQCSATATVPTTTDNCGATITGTTSDPLTYNTQGTHVITWTFDDGNGNTSTQTQNVVIDDTTAPDTPTLDDVTGQCSATATIPTTTDNCGATITGTTSDPLTYNTQGTHVITWTFDDGNGQFINVNQNVIIDDTTPPDTPTLDDVTGQCSASATVPTTTDNCGATITGTTSDPLTYNTQGTHVITWTFDDGNGQSINVNQNVIIDDTTLPDTPTLDDVTGQCSATATVPTTTDNCGATITGTTSDPLTYNTQGTHVITWTFDDGNGQFINVNQNVIIDDTTPPDTPTLDDVTGQCSATATIPTTTDNCGATITGTTSDPLTYNTQGTHVITWTFDDGNGQFINVNQNVIIDDTTLPDIPTLDDVTGQCSATATVPTTTDNCGATITGTTSDPLTYNTQGTHVITWTFDDGNGNTSTQTQNVVIDDNTAPIITLNGSANMTVEACDTYTELGATATDNCSAIGPVIIGGDTVDTSTIGVYSVTYNITDPQGNVATQLIRTVNVVDTTAPIITLGGPNPQIVDACDSYLELGATAFDPCFGDISGSIIIDASAVIPNTVGSYSVTYIVMDVNGNSAAEVIRVVNVVDASTPTAACQNITIQLDASGNATITTADIDNGSSDSCGIASMSISQDTFDCSHIGVNNVTLTVTDNNGNVSTCESTVTVEDIIDPNAICQDITLQLDASGNASLVAADIDNGSNDVCSTVTLDASQTSFDCSHIGSNAVTLTVTDANGNTSSCVATVMVQDNLAPTVSSLSDITVGCSSDFPLPDESTVTVTDNCTYTVIHLSDVSDGNTNPETIIRTYEVTDDGGNTVTVSQNIIINYNVTPFISNDYQVTTCSGDTASIVLSNGVDGNIIPIGTTYSWGLPVISGGITGATVGNNASGFSQTLTNTSNAPQTATYTVSAGLGTCTPSTFEVVVTVNPTPTLTALPASQPNVCNGNAIDPITLTNPNNISGVSYSYTRTNNTNLTGTLTISGNSITGTLNNTTNSPQTTNITIIATANGCQSVPETVSITVNPTPVAVATPTTQDICSGDTATINLSILPALTGTTTYSWTRTNTTNVTGTTSQTNISGPISVNLTNTTTTTQTTTFEITANTNGCSSVVTYVDVTVYAPLSDTFVIGDSQDVCNGRNPADIQISVAPTGGSGSFNYQWQEYDNDNNTWIDIPNANNPVYTPPNVANRYQLIISDQACTSNTSTSNEVIINYNGDIGGLSDYINAGLSISNAPNTGYCDGDEIRPTFKINHTRLSTITFSFSYDATYVSTDHDVMNVTPVNRVYWLFGFIPIPYRSSTLNNVPFTLHNPGNSTVTTQINVTPYYNVGNQTPCSADSEVINVTIHPTPNATTTIVNPTICSGSSPGITVDGNITDNDMQFNWSIPTITGITSSVGNSGTITTSGGTTGINTFDIPGTLTNSSNSPIDVIYTITPLATTTPSCPGTPFDVTVTVLPTVNGGTISTDQVVCSGDMPTVLTGNASSLQPSGSVSYQWEISTDNVNFSPISGATSQNYTPTSSITSVTHYRRTVVYTYNGVTCTGASNVITITPNATTAGTIGSNQTVCSGTIPATLTNTASATASASGSSISYLWESAPTASGPWSSTGVTTSDYPFSAALTTTTFYRRVATITNGSSSCITYSNVITIFVNNIDINSLNSNQTVCSNVRPSTLSVSASGFGILSYQWQQSNSVSGPWSNIGANQATYTPPILTQTMYYQVIITSTNGGSVCSETSSTLTVIVNPYVVADAGSDVDYSTSNCGATSVTLNATNPTGQWTVTSGQSAATYTFSDINNPNATFTGELDETYTLEWQVTNTSPCPNTSDTINITFASCGDFIDFDGVNDYVDLSDSYDFSSDFSLELWVKRQSTSNSIETLLSKRDVTNPTSGYELTLNNGTVNFTSNNNSPIVSSIGITNTRWHHVALTYISGTYTIYIDGINAGSATGSTPSANSFSSLIGASGNSSGEPTKYFNGALDEVRFWNIGLNENQIRFMMNQEIEMNGSTIHGTVIPLEVNGLSWSNLVGYYQMNQSSDITGGNLIAIKGTDGLLRNISTNQPETAPLPYISVNNGVWNTNNTWLYGSDQVTPNTNGMNWNIVRTQHNITSGNRATALLGLVVDNNKYTIDNDQLLNVTRYLKIDGILDLEGESQLIQPENSIVDYTGTGKLERDQQGTSNEFNYNYWGSPVTNVGPTRVFALGSILYDGSNPVNWTTSYDAPGTSNPVTLSNRWLYTYNDADGSISQWNRFNETSNIDIGLGFTMKGSGLGTPDQNYTFSGQPNNGLITIGISSDMETLIGNPYPSAIDANTFIMDNQSATLDGTLTFWEQAPSSTSHVLADYLGRYSYYNLSGGLPAATIPSEIGGSGDALKLPRRYIPVAQGFFVKADSDGGTLQFNNNQRIFKKESLGESIFFRSDENNITNYNAFRDESTQNSIQRVRLAYKGPEGDERHLLLAFTPNNAATEGIDYGYDGLNSEYLASDMSFIIEDDKYVIQGVGAFDEENTYPVTIDMGVTGQAEIAVTDLENFDTDPDVYVYDSLIGTYTRINVSPYQITLDAGTHANRFYIVFQPDNTLDVTTETYPDVIVNYLNDTNQIYINLPNSMHIKQVYLVNMLGQTVKSWNSTNAPLSQECRIPVRLISEGNYIIKVQTLDNHTITKKIVVKQH
ncbi:LamG-like jellyroll fold domain-containing protein [Bizionia sp. KMM 8389]